jgi:hypothetical protein
VDDLKSFEREWRGRRKKMTLKKAIDFCRERRVTEPRWLLEAFCELGRDSVMRLKKTGRRTDLLNDDVLYTTVEDYRQQGLSRNKAFEMAARDHRMIKGRYAETNFTVKSAWLRHKKRIIKDDSGPLGWRIRGESIGNDRNAKFARTGKGLPPLTWRASRVTPFRTKNQTL